MDSYQTEEDQQQQQQPNENISYDVIIRRKGTSRELITAFSITFCPELYGFIPGRLCDQTLLFDFGNEQLDI